MARPRFDLTFSQNPLTISAHLWQVYFFRHLLQRTGVFVLVVLVYDVKGLHGTCQLALSQLLPPAGCLLGHQNPEFTEQH
jgi:hypothetical protein